MADLRIINATPHEINFYKEDGTIVSYPPSGMVARVESTSVVSTLTPFSPVKLVNTRFGQVEGMPEDISLDDVLIIVSRLVLAAKPFNSALIVPTDMVRDDEGRIIGCRAFDTSVL